MKPEQLDFMHEREYITFFVSYRNIYEKLTDEQKVKFIDAIFSYSFDGKEIEDLDLSDPILNIVFDGVLPNLNNNRVKFLNGKLSKESDKNGRPKKAKKRLTKGEIKANERLTKGNKNINKNINNKKEEEASEEFLILARYWAKSKRSTNPTLRLTESTGAEWADVIRLMVDRDKYTLETIKTVMDGINKDNFWHNNFTCLKKFRKHLQDGKFEKFSNSKASTVKVEYTKL